MIVLTALCVSCVSSGDDDAIVPLASTSSPPQPVVDTSNPPDTSGPASTSAPVTSAAPATPPEWTSEQLEVIAAFEAAELAFRRARMEPIDVSAPGLAETHTPEAREVVSTILARRAAAGRATRWPSGIEIRGRIDEVEIAGEQATVGGCQFDEGVVYSIADGVIFDDSSVTRSFVARLRVVGDRWRLAAFKYGDAVGEECGS